MAKDKANIVVELRQPEIPYEGQPAPKGRVRITVEGIGLGLLTHNPAAMQVAGEEGKRGGRVPKPDDEAERGCYRMEDGTCAIKTDMFLSAIAGKTGAAGAWKTKNRSTMKSRLAHIVATESMVPLHYPDGKPIRDYVIDQQPAVIGKARVIRARPRYDRWRASFCIEYDTQLVADPKMIVDICADAGSRIGVGDYRPKHGRFRVVSYLID